MAKKHPAVIVKWRDSASLRGWQDIDTKHGPAEITTIGWLIEKNKKQVLIASCVSYEGSIRDALAIPRSCVTSLEKLPHHIESA